jgi:hypothetical protein
MGEEQEPVHAPVPEGIDRIRVISLNWKSDICYNYSVVKKD